MQSLRAADFAFFPSVLRPRPFFLCIMKALLELHFFPNGFPIMYLRENCFYLLLVLKYNQTKVLFYLSFVLDNLKSYKNSLPLLIVPGKCKLYVM